MQMRFEIFYDMITLSLSLSLSLSGLNKSPANQNNFYKPKN